MTLYLNGHNEENPNTKIIETVYKQQRSNPINQTQHKINNWGNESKIRITKRNLNKNLRT